MNNIILCASMKLKIYIINTFRENVFYIHYTIYYYLETLKKSPKQKNNSIV